MDKNMENLVGKQVQVKSYLPEPGRFVFPVLLEVTSKDPGTEDMYAAGEERREQRELIPGDTYEVCEVTRRASGSRLYDVRMARQGRTYVFLAYNISYFGDYFNIS